MGNVISAGVGQAPARQAAMFAGSSSLIYLNVHLHMFRDAFGRVH